MKAPRSVLWFLPILAYDILVFWVMKQPAILDNPIVKIAFPILLAIPPFGFFWMFYQAVRYEKKPILFAVLAFMPYAFLWYYFERYRKRKLSGALPAASGSSPGK